MMRSRWRVAAVAMTVAGSIEAQEARYLAPERYEAAKGDVLTLRLKTAEAVAPWPVAEMRYVFVRASGTQENRRRLEAPKDGPASWTIAHQGLHVIGIDLAPRSEEVRGDSLAAFIDAHAPESLEARPEAEGMATIRRVESFKTLVRVDAVEGPSGTATDKTSLDVDIRLLMDPTAMSPGSTLAFRTYVEGSSAPGARVIATHVESGERTETETDASAIGDLKLERAGVWRLEFHDVTPPTEETPWTIHSSTVTFEIAEEAE